jgi:NAD-dependent dihydropyrimidine dehydrogenase PreA subunit
MNRMSEIAMNVKRWIMPLSSLQEAEQTIFSRDDCIRALKGAPQQFRFSDTADHEKGSRISALTRMLRMFPILRRLGKDIITSLETIDKNPKAPNDTVSEAFLQEFEDYAYSLGIGAIGYTKLPREAVFRDKAVLFDRVIVVAMEMDKNKIDAAPSAETMHMVMDTYYGLGRAVNSLVDYLRRNGYAVQGGHPMGGQALYPLMAEKAGMGYHGRHGMIITPQFGPRHRLAAIYCSIKNLPHVEENEHAWIADYCDRCGQCIKACPVNAIYERPIVRESGIITHINAGTCFQYFNNNYSCSLCIKECLFNYRPYHELGRSFLGSKAVAT